jgi:RHS repeat-associated protein
LYRQNGIAASLTVAATTAWTAGVAYEYDGAGNVTNVGDDSFIYDSVDRLVSGTVSGKERRYEYDAFGNRTKCTDVASGGGDCQTATIIASSNRLASATYDEAGSMTMYSGKTYTYDAAGMLQADTAAPMAREYVYTADDERIAVIVGSTWTWSLRDLSGKVLREMTSTAGASGAHSNWQWTRDNVWRNGLLLSSVQPSGTSTSTWHYHLDHLGTPRVVSTTSGTILGSHEYFAFGTEISGNTKENPESRMKFTGHERDSFGGPTEQLDYMHARYYSAQWGRFLSPDPVFGEVRQPQGWNRYAYVFNNPIKFVDPLGLRAEDGAGETITVEADSPETERKKRLEAEAIREFQLRMLMLWLQIPTSAHGEKLNWLPSRDGNNVAAFFSSTPPNTILIDAHGTSQTVHLMKAAALAAQIRREAETLRPGTIIILNSCNAAAGDNSIAQQLSVLLPTNPVVGYDRQRWTFGVDLGSWGKWGPLPNLVDPGRAWMFVNGVGTDMP